MTEQKRNNNIAFFLSMHGPELISEQGMLKLIKELYKRVREVNEQVALDLDKLSPKERALFVSLFGLEGQEPKTREEIGMGWGVTRERVRMIEAKAFRKVGICFFPA